MRQSRVVSQAIEHLDQVRENVLREDPAADPSEGLSQVEKDWTQKEIIKSRHDFEYASGNYFWINQTKNSREQLFELWEAQQLLYDIILSFWRQEKPAWILVHKARQLGLTTVTLALMVWKIIFYRQQVGMIIAQNPEHAAFMMSKVQYTMSMLPWWMQPEYGRLEVKEYMDFPKMGNMLIANGANKMSSFGQGKPIHILSGSELSTWTPAWRARRIVQGDLKAALVDLPGCFAVFESKPNGATGFWHDTWCYYAEELNKKGHAQFYSMFVPAFFEPQRSKTPPENFQPRSEVILPTFRSEIELRERYSLEWHKCRACGKPVYANCKDFSECVACGSTEHDPVILSSAQLYWYRIQLEGLNPKDKESIKYWKQEMAVTAEEGFQAHGHQVFPDDVYEWVKMNARPGRWRGRFDAERNFHDNSKKCYCCNQDHSWEDFPLEVWELPRQGFRYIIGADVAYGEEGDYSVISVHRMGSGFEVPDEQVAEYRSNVISAGQFATECYLIGKAYNDAKVCIEAHGIGDTTQYELMRMGYANLFQWKHYDSTTHMKTNKVGWWTNYQTKQYLIATFIKWCRQKIFMPRSLTLLHEMPTFTRDFDEDDYGGRATKGAKDDSIMATMICLFCSHDEDFDYERGRIIIPDARYRQQMGTPEENKIWNCFCVCGNTWDAANPRESRCPKCGKPVERATKKAKTNESGERVSAQAMVGDEEDRQHPVGMDDGLVHVTDFNLM